jgi:hypothetical protein
MDPTELENLSDAEREALEGEDVSTPAEVEAAAAAAEVVVDDDPEVPAVETPVVADDMPLRLAPPALEGADEQLNALLDQRKTIREQYRNGDIAAEDKDRSEDEINDKIADIRAAKQNAAFVENFNQQTEENDYLRTVRSVKAEIKEKDGIDYDNNAMLIQSLDLKVRAIARDPANADKPADWFIKEAHKQVLAELELAATAAGFKRDKPTPADPVRDAVRSRKPDMSGAKSLAALPTAASESPGDGREFAHLDGLDGEALEIAVAKMTPEQERRWAEQP